MCQRNITVTETGKVEHCTGFDRKQLQEIDIRVGARLLEREMMRAEYVRGLTDAIYWLAIFAVLTYTAYIYFTADK